MKQLKVLTKLQEIHLLVSCFISFFTVAVTSSIQSSFEMNKVNPFPAMKAPFPLIFRSNLFISLEVKFLTNPSKFSRATGIAIFLSALFSQN